MRNLVQYPITPEEVIESLGRNQAYIAEKSEGLIGAMDPILLETALSVVKTAALIIKNSGDSNNKQLLIQAFNSQNPNSA